MSIVGCYVLHVLCDETLHDPLLPRQEEFTSAVEKEALRAAKLAGWTLLGARAICRHCYKKRIDNLLKEKA